MSILDKPYPLLGIPFKYGGRGPKFFDCWGLTMEVFKRFEINIPDYELCSIYQDLNENLIDSASEKINGCVGSFKWGWEEVQTPIPPSIIPIRFNHPNMINHVGVYIGDGKFIHTRDKVGVCIDRINSISWERKLNGFYVYRG